MKCSNCGAEIGTNTQCAYCGTVQQQETPVSQQGVPVPPPYPTQQPYNGQPNVQQPPYTVPPQAAQQNPNGVPPYRDVYKRQDASTPFTGSLYMHII